MSADPVREEEHDEQLQEMIRLVRVLDLRAPAELARLFTSHGLGDDVRRAAEAMAAFPVPDEPGAQSKHTGPARKVSVSMPEDLTTAVQQRVGRGKFSQYVTEAVARQFELDLLTELLELLASEHGPVPESDLAEARAAWPGDE
jgi:hypothetical protein